MSRNLLIIIWSILMPHSLLAQSKWGLENYHYLGQPGEPVIVPSVRLETRHHWYTELRYNYEDARTFSAFTGRTFGKGNIYITPMLGISAGGFTGISFAFKTGMEWNKFYGASQTQYSISIRKADTSFFFTWTEMGYHLTPHLFTGPAVQFTHESGQNEWHAGWLAGWNLGSISVPVYVFNPFTRERYVVVGINVEFTTRKKR